SVTLRAPTQISTLSLHDALPISFGRENLSHAPTRREAHVRHAVGVSEPHADGGRRQTLLVQADDRLLDLRLFHPDPFRIRLQVRSGRSALSLAVRMDASHRFPREGLRIPRNRI